MNEFICLVAPASIGVLIFTRQSKDFKSINIFLLYLFNVLMTNLFYNLIMINFFPNAKINYSTIENIKIMLLMSLISFVLGLIYIYVNKRFSIIIEDSKNEKKSK